MIRVHDNIRRINLSEMTAEEVGNMVTSIMNDHQCKIFQQDLEVDLSFKLPNVVRFRVNAFTSSRGPTAIFRTIPSTVLTLGGLRVPCIFQEIADNPRGLVLVTGPAGSGKPTTLATIINYINEAQSVYTLTIEDPIELVHPSKKTLINRCELYQHTHDFVNTLRSASREDFDMILVGEICDPGIIGLAPTAAETGHLVLGMLHTTDAAKAVDRIVDVFPTGEEEMMRSMLSESLRTVVSQALLKTHDGSGRVAAHEILISTPAVRNLIRGNKIVQINSILQTDRAHGMQTLDQALQALIH